MISPCLQVAVLLHFLVEPFANATMEDVQLFELQEQGGTQEGY